MRNYSGIQVRIATCMSFQQNILPTTSPLTIDESTAHSRQVTRP